MIITLSPSQYDKNNITFSNKSKNNKLDGGEFRRIFYSLPSCSMNGIYLSFDMDDVCLESYFNKIKCTFDITKNKDIINTINDIESGIMSISPNNGKLPIYRIYEQLSSGFVKIFTNNEGCKCYKKRIRLVLKISGTWIDSESCGVTFRFFFQPSANPLLPFFRNIQHKNITVADKLSSTGDSSG